MILDTVRRISAVLISATFDVMLERKMGFRCDRMGLRLYSDTVLMTCTTMLNTVKTPIHHTPR